MKTKVTVILVVAFLILIVLSLGVAIIYSDYLYNPNGSLSTLQISNADESGYIDSTSSSKDKKFLQELDRWAAQNNATILFKDGLTAGAGYCGYSDWIDVHLEIQNTVSNDIGVYVQNSSIVFDPYVTDDVFLAGIAGLKIAGTYNEDNVPVILRNVDFLYPISFSISAEGMYFTDARDLESLISLFEDNGYLLLSRRDADMVPIDKLITKLFSDGPLSIAVCVSMFGLAFCVVYIILILFRDITPTLSIHYLFGLSFRRIVCNGISISVFLIILASILSHYLLTNSLTYLSRIDLQKIFKISFVIYFALVGFIDVVGFYCLSRRLRGKGGK